MRLSLSLLAWRGIGICDFDDLVDDSHNEIIVSAVLPVFKGNVSVVKEVVCDYLHVIYFLENFVQPFIDIVWKTWRYFSPRYGRLLFLRFHQQPWRILELLHLESSIWTGRYYWEFLGSSRLSFGHSSFPQRDSNERLMTSHLCKPILSMPRSHLSYICPLKAGQCQLRYAYLLLQNSWVLVLSVWILDFEGFFAYPPLSLRFNLVSERVLILTFI